MIKLGTFERMLVYTFICIPVRLVLEYTLIHYRLWYAFYLLAIGFFITGTFFRSRKGYFGGTRNWSNWVMSLQFFFLGSFILRNEIKAAHATSLWFMILTYIAHLETTIFNS